MSCDSREESVAHKSKSNASDTIFGIQSTSVNQQNGKWNIEGVSDVSDLLRDHCRFYLYITEERGLRGQ